MKLINMIILSMMLLFMAGCTGSYNFEENQFGDKTEVKGEIETNDKEITGNVALDKENKEITGNIKVRSENSVDID